MNEMRLNLNFGSGTNHKRLFLITRFIIIDYVDQLMGRLSILDQACWVKYFWITDFNSRSTVLNAKLHLDKLSKWWYTMLRGDKMLFS